MCGKRFVLGALVLSLAPLSLWAQATSSPGTQTQSSKAISETPEQLWSTLKLLIDLQPNQLAEYNQSLTEQIKSLQSRNDSLVSSSLDLTTSLSQLKDEVATLKVNLSRSETDLTRSSGSIIKAQNDAKASERNVLMLKIGCVSLGIGFGVLGVYETGRYYNLWK